MSIIIWIACLLSLVFGDETETVASLSYTSDNFDAELAKSNHFVMFFAPWCGHCKRLSPTWDELGKEYNNNDGSEVRIAKVDCTIDTGLCAKYDVTGYPTLKFFKLGETGAVRYKGSRDITSLKAFIEEQVIKDSEDAEGDVSAGKQKGVVYELTDETFDKHIEKGNHFVKFYAPWCGHCKRLAPVWDMLAEAFTNEKSVTIAKVDCTSEKSLCQLHSIRGYPSLYFFSDGMQVDTYNKARGLEELKTYVNKMVKDYIMKKENINDKFEEVLKDAEPEGPFELTPDDFERRVEGKIAFVKFYAPWCGHCKRLAPVWEEFAKKVHKPKQGLIDPMIVKVDCSLYQKFCQKYGVRGYPTLQLLKDGKKVTEYTGSRDEDSLMSFLSEHTKEKRDEL